MASSVGLGQGEVGNGSPTDRANVERELTQRRARARGAANEDSFTPVPARNAFRNVVTPIRPGYFRVAGLFWISAEAAANGAWEEMGDCSGSTLGPEEMDLLF